MRKNGKKGREIRKLMRARTRDMVFRNNWRANRERSGRSMGLIAKFMVSFYGTLRLAESGRARKLYDGCTKLFVFVSDIGMNYKSSTQLF